MQTIINKFNISLSGEDLYLCWQDELRLRQQLRVAEDWEGVYIESSEEFHFLKRCLYFGSRKEVFFTIVYHNISSLPILNCVLGAPFTFITDFLHFIADNILMQNSPARDLHFLINMYRDEFRSDYTELIKAMDDELCAHLLARTSNDTLRELFKARQSQIMLDQDSKDYGLVDFALSRNDYPTIYGDKIELMAKAAKTLQACHIPDSTTPLTPAAIKMLLDGVDLLFRAGLLGDCLALLARIRESEGQIPVLSNEEPYYKQISVILRKVLPIYSLLNNPANPHRYVLDIHRSLFPGFSPDPVSLLYLDIYSIVMTNMQGHRQFARYELAQKASKILNRHPDDLLASALLRWGEKLTPDNITELEQLAEQKIYGLPHEAYIIMEVLRFWQHDGTITLNRMTATSLLRNYIKFFYWLPGTSFINAKLLKQLVPLVDEDTRNAVEIIVAVLHEFSFQDSTQKISAPPIPDMEKDKLLKQLRLSKYMGVF